MGDDKEGIEGNNPVIGKNGKAYRKLIKDNNLTLVNNTNNCKGKWTRMQGDKKSILDLTIVTKNLEKKTKLEIDETKYTIERAETDHKTTDNSR